MERSKAFIVLRQHSQAILDFSVLVCTAVPQLEHAFNEHSTDNTVFLAQNSQFRDSHEPYSTEKRTITSYKEIQGANLFLSTFSFFESYFFSVIDEIIEFHGGEEEIIKLVEKRIKRPFRLSTQEEDNLSKLQKPFKKHQSDRYKKFTDLLKTSQMVWPTETFALYGLKQVIANRKRWKSVNIPEISLGLLLYDIPSSDQGKFQNLREIRNKIAHGKNFNYDLTKAIDANYFFYKLASEIDNHVCKYFFIVEKYR